MHMFGHFISNPRAPIHVEWHPWKIRASWQPKMPGRTRSQQVASNKKTRPHSKHIRLLIGFSAINVFSEVSQAHSSKQSAQETGDNTDAPCVADGTCEMRLVHAIRYHQRQLREPLTSCHLPSVHEELAAKEIVLETPAPCPREAWRVPRILPCNCS